MKKCLGRFLVVFAVIAVYSATIGRMEYNDHLVDVARTEEIRAKFLLSNADRPSPDSICLNDPPQHSLTQHE